MILFSADFLLFMFPGLGGEETDECDDWCCDAVENK